MCYKFSAFDLNNAYFLCAKCWRPLNSGEFLDCVPVAWLIMMERIKDR